ncbi:hypothetical protein [Telmatospirillum sp.]|uniref:hypothetical protein n=1 Tax=Telmatospirillum sp. TaxID=2079197 RepID=UPI0028440C9F|nr:hypothetical protein [Telmatospirillum sp.]MDR3438763.1 hypothetical protein [Telmatospirillum sp.]
MTVSAKAEVANNDTNANAAQESIGFIGFLHDDLIYFERRNTAWRGALSLPGNLRKKVRLVVLQTGVTIFISFCIFFLNYDTVHYLDVFLPVRSRSVV